MIIPSFWTSADGEEGLLHNPKCEEVFLQNTVISRAFENECCVVFVNCGGKSEDGFIGESAVALPFLGSVGRAVSFVSSSMFEPGRDTDELLSSSRKVTKKKCF